MVHSRMYFVRIFLMCIYMVQVLSSSLSLDISALVHQHIFSAVFQLCYFANRYIRCIFLRLSKFWLQHFIQNFKESDVWFKSLTGHRKIQLIDSATNTATRSPEAFKRPAII